MPVATPPKISVDWTVPLWGIVGVLVQALVLAGFIATLSSNVTQNTEAIKKIDGRVAALENTQATVARLDERTKYIYDILSKREAN